MMVNILGIPSHFQTDFVPEQIHHSITFIEEIIDKNWIEANRINKSHFKP